MKKVLLYFPLSLQRKNIGIVKKCIGITDAFRQKYNTDVFNESEGKIYFNDALIKDFSQSKSRLRYYHYNNHFFLGQFSAIRDKIKINKYDIVYIRFSQFISIGFLLFLRSLKKNNPQVIISVEIPTYPYRHELNGTMHKIRYWITWFLIPIFRKYVSNIVTFSRHTKIWNIPAINISNGYYNPDLQQLGAENIVKNIKPLNNVFHIGMVAQFSSWHAPDILINSLYFYFKNRLKSVDVILHLIGSGPEMNDYKKYVQTKGLDDKVIFYGEKSTMEIIKILNNVQVCIGTLGHHRKNIQLDSSLKNREYAFLGIPMILKTPDLDFLIHFTL
ncbi:MAG: hypothetical protein IPP81_01930 [Chitinophagaceae bacterium]|nr:hypothetical protein [Chitinophagaceae bacterium]